MAQQKKGLGKGLSALIPEGDMDFLTQVARGLDLNQSEPGRAAVVKAPKQHAAKNAAAAAMDASAGSKESIQPESGGSVEVEVHWIPVGDVQPNPFQPRRHFRQQDLEELAESLREHGILQPVLVRPSPGDGPAYQLVAGERRWRAAQLAGLAAVPAIVRQVGDQQALELAIIENVQRHDISPLDAALAYHRLSKEFGLSQEQLASRVGKSRSAVANTIRLLELTEEAQRAIEDGRISEGHGRALLQAPDQDSQRAILHRALRDGLSVRDVEQLARHAATRGASEANRVPRSPDPEIAHLEKRLEKALGSPVRLKAQGSGGHVVIEYFNLDDLDRLIDLFISK